MSTPGEVQQTVGPSKAWLTACGCLCLAILAFGVFGYKEFSGDPAHQFGYNLPIAIVLACGLHFAFRKIETSQASWFAFALIYISLLAASQIANQRQKADLREATVQVQQTISAAQAATSGGTTVPFSVPDADVGGSEGARVGAVVKTIFNRLLVQRHEYELELDAIGWSQILDGSRLKSDVTLIESRAMLQQARGIVLKYKSKSPDLFSKMRQDIENSDLNSNYKQSMLVGFDRALFQAKARSMEQWALEEDVLDQMENVFSLLTARRNAWQIQGGKIMFQTQEDLDLFNLHLAKIESIVAKQEQMQTSSFQRSQETLSKLMK